MGAISSFSCITKAFSGTFPFGLFKEIYYLKKKINALFSDSIPAL